ncbi:MAG: DctP family TRAP transporter solute-binding subunit [Deltaproteobacteria bacterium]|nr:DctP family TRAP transporter solute-binding subunit [Deltaproteobacteria bacterium]
MKSDRAVPTILALAAAIFFTFAGLTTAKAEVLNLKFAHFGEETHPSNLAAKQFAAKVLERTNGQVKITIYPNNVLGSPNEQAEQVRLGAIDIALCTQGQLDKYVKAFSVVMLPFIYDDYDHVHRVLDGPSRDWFNPLAEKEGFVMLSNWEWGFRNMTNNVRPVLKPEDAKGLKIRTPPEIQLQVTMEAMGAIVTKIAFPEVYMALAQKVVDGQENPVAVIYHNKFYEVQKHMSLTRHIYNNMIQEVSKKTWAKLTPEQQTIFREESKSAGDYMRKLIMSQEESDLAKMEKDGMKIARPNLAPFRAAMGPAYEKIGKYSGEENVKRFMKYVEDARKK